MIFKRFAINSGGKFKPESGVAVIFEDAKSVGVSGDAACGKSTFLNLFRMTCGQYGGAEVVEALKNLETGLIDTELEFSHAKADYFVKCRNGELTVKKEGEKLGSPQSLLKELLGVVGVSPMDIKDADVEAQIKWLAQYSTVGADDFVKKMRKLKDDAKAAKDSRADANRVAKGIRQYLISEGVMADDGQLIEKVWLANEKKYAQKPPEIAELSKKLSEAQKKAIKYAEAENRVKAHKEKKADIEAKIAALQEELKLADNGIAAGETWLEQNKDHKTAASEIQKQYDTAAAEAVNYNKWKEIEAKYKELDQFEEIAKAADGREKDIIKKKQELMWEVIPDSRGVELLLEDEYEDGKLTRKAGLYKDGMSSRQMSATEWLQAVLHILKKTKKLKVIVLDDISQYGSELIEHLQKLAAAGYYILFSEMSRGSTEIKIKLD